MNSAVSKSTIPWTASWSSENRFEVRICAYANGKLALCQNESPGVGRPMFAAPHAVRQRKAMALCLCDICGKPLQGRTKVSLSQESPRSIPGIGVRPLAVEPMVHRDCALVALRYCPSLRRQQSNGSLRIRQVFAYGLIGQQLNALATMEAAGVRAPGAIGHLKLLIHKWKDRDMAWLEAEAEANAVRRVTAD